jgi:hypothetical protein
VRRLDEEISSRNIGLLTEFPGLQNEGDGIMRRLAKDTRHHKTNDIRDWYFIGFVALVSALVAWLPLLGRVRL